MGAERSDQVILGRVISAYGVKGWVKVYSYTDPIENILSYQPWLLRIENNWREASVEQGRKLGKAIIVRFEGCGSRDEAATYCGNEIAINSTQLPALMDGEYYWQQLEGLSVVDLHGNLLGMVDHLLETGANDVLVVRGDHLSNIKEHLIPFVKGRVIRGIDLTEGKIEVDWDLDFQ